MSDTGWIYSTFKYKSVKFFYHKGKESTSVSKVNYKIQVISESGKTCCITGVDNENAVLYKLPETIQGYKVVGIKTGVFENCHRIKKHYFPKYT